MTSNTQATTLVDHQPEPHYNLLFSLEYGNGSRCWRRTPVADMEPPDQATVIAQNIPIRVLHSFDVHLSAHLVRPISAQDACKLWDVFYGLYLFDEDRFEGRWQFICRHYKP